MRWQEEVTLTSYEMQWTVRYFGYMSRKWVIPSGVPIGSSRIGSSRIGSSGDSIAFSTGGSTGTDFLSPKNHSAGAIAYSKRKQSLWEDLMKKADNIFRSTNPAYQSPF